MDFSASKPTHLLALVAVMGTLVIFALFPIYSFFALPLDLSPSYQDLLKNQSLLFELVLVAMQFLLIGILLVGVPLLWYVLVNKLSLPQILGRLQIRRDGFLNAVGVGLLGAFIMLAVVLAASAVLLYLGIAESEAGNLQDFEQFLSAPSILLLILLQPIAEEIFYRGFLFEKLQGLGGPTTAVLGTAVLFGIAHLTYGKFIPALLIAGIGVILGLLMLRTKNLAAVVTAHIAFNLANFALYFFAKAFLP